MAAALSFITLNLISQEINANSSQEAIGKSLTPFSSLFLSARKKKDGNLVLSFSSPEKKKKFPLFTLLSQESPCFLATFPISP